MNPTRLAVVAFVLATAASTLIAGPARADTVAQENPAVVIAQDTTPAPVTIPATVVGIDANVVGGLSVTGHGGKPVTVTARGQRTRRVTVPANRPAVLRHLTAGVRYTVAIAGRRIGTAVPLAQVGAASGLRVETTSIPGTVLVTWSHAPRAGEGPAISFDVTATPLTADGTDGPDVVSVIATGRSATLTGLNPDRLYTIGVTPRNTASTGRASAATMNRTLNAITGVATVPASPVPTPAVPAASTPAPAAAPAPASAPAPAPVPAPMKTIYVCPDGYTESTTGTCQKTLAYTYSDVTVTSPYTYTQETRSGGACSYLPNPNAPGGFDIYCPTYTVDIKNAPPSGWTDSGSSYSKTVPTKNPTPAGYADDGTQWVTTVAKVPVQVPA